MNRRASLLIGALALVAATWCYLNFERVTEREFVGFSGEAARNPLLAFQRLVTGMGLETKVARKNLDLEHLPPQGTLVLSGNRYGMTRERVKAITDWVSGGAHLIVEAEDAEDRDPLLDALGVARREAPAGRSCPSDVAVRLPGEKASLRADVPPMEFKYTGGGESYSAPAGRSNALLHIRYGSGQVSVLSSLDFMRNGKIGEHDHAALAWGLVRLKPDTGQVVIAPRFEQLSLVEWFRDNALGASLAAGTLLALWLWRIARRFGPVEPPHEPRRRRLLDHLRASGHFQWSAGSGAALLAAAREACLAKIARTQPGVADLPPGERSTRLAELTRLPPAEVEHAFTGEATHQRAFTAAVSTLQQIEEKITRTASA